MDLYVFLQVAAASSAIAILWQILTRIYPYYKKMQIQKSLATLSRCFRMLNQDALPNGRIRHGHYLHDRFYHIVLKVMTHKIDLRFSALKNAISHTTPDPAMTAFRKEVDALDPKSREVVWDAVFAMAKILALRSPITFGIMVLLSSIKNHHQDHGMHGGRVKKRLKRNMVSSAEQLAVRGRDTDLDLSPFGCAS